MAESDTPEFTLGIWWVPDGTGARRPALGQECAAEIQRLRGVIAEALAVKADADPCAAGYSGVCEAMARVLRGAT